MTASTLPGAGETYEYPAGGTPDGPFRLPQDPYPSQPDKLRVACVGAGASGLCLAYKMEKMMVPGSWELTLFEKKIKGSLFGSSNPRADIPKMLDLYNHGHLKLDELITKRYTLDEVAQGYEDMHAGKNIRGVLVFD